MMIINGQFVAFCSYYGEEASGDLSIVEDFGVVSSLFQYSVDGTLVINNLIRLGFRHDLIGNLTFNSGTEALWKITHPVAGMMTIGVDFGVISPYHLYETSGSVILASDTYYQSSDLGELEVDGGVVTDLEELGTVFGIEAAPAISLSVTDISLPLCCPTTVASLLDLKHNLSSLVSLGRFLTRNGLELVGDFADDTAIVLSYNSRLQSWRGNRHYTGRSYVNNSTESWDLNFEFRCTKQSGGSSLGANAWEFSFLIRRKVDATGQVFIARFVGLWGKDVVCPAGRPFDEFDFVFNLQNLVVSPQGLRSPVFHDESGLFLESSSFNNIRFQISAAGADGRVTTDHILEEQRYAASHVADLSGHPL